jgi:hypothetical protein
MMHSTLDVKKTINMTHGHEYQPSLISQDALHAHEQIVLEKKNSVVLVRMRTILTK